ncbi:MAG: ATPase, T2SS/T4P/T4SS family [Rhodobacteraceae bacterium]|nr:ATPase, T2SS/T4P/T4SS family [Paracoccaceae bacterium]
MAGIDLNRRFGAPIANEYAPQLLVDRNRNQITLEGGQPERIDAKHLRSFLMSCSLAGASDITIQSDRHPRVEIDGTLHFLAGKAWSPSEVDLALTELYRAPNASAEIRGRKVLDFAYELRKADFTRQRFRINATGIHIQDGHGVELSVRILPASTPTLEDVGLEPRILSNFCPSDGLVLIAGATGSGKSSTLAAIARHFLESAVPRKIIDLQAPIEFTYEDVAMSGQFSASIIGQSEVGTHIVDFAQGVRAALRRNPDIIIIGELRDRETMNLALEAALTGHIVYATVHASSVSDCMGRMLATMSLNERDRRSYDLVSVLRLVQVQCLVDELHRNGRLAVRSWLRFSPRLRRELLAVDHCRWPEMVHTHLARCRKQLQQDIQGRSLSDAVAELHQQGRISCETAQSLTESSILPATSSQ